MSKTLRLMSDWKGMAPDNPRDGMNQNQVWRLEDYIPRSLGSKLESRQGWTYHTTTPLDGYPTAQIWVNTLGGSHHLAATRHTLYNLDVPATPRNVTSAEGALWPMATLYEYVLIPLSPVAGVYQLPVVIRYAAGTEVVVTTHTSTPKAKVATTWQSRFVLGNGEVAGVVQPNFIYFLSQEWGAGLTTTPLWDPKAYIETPSDVTGLAALRNSLMIFHEGTVERLRGTKAPGQDIEPDVWMEPLMGGGGCNEPHTIQYWNDNLLFADARGVYLTDGTQIKDITEQGGIQREWWRAYDPLWRVSAGVVFNCYVIAMVDLSQNLFKKCFVCDLASRNWTIFNNIPFASFVGSVGEIQHLFGGGFDGKIADLSSMWAEADTATDTLDGNNTAVLPQLETAWYRMSENSQMKRLKNVYFDFDLDETTGEVRVYGCKQVQPRSPSDWILLRTIQEGDLLDNRGVGIDVDGYRRRRIPVGMQSYGFAFKIETVGKIKNLKLYDFAAELMPSREETYAGIA